MKHQLSFESNGIYFQGYEFRQATIYPRGLVRYEEIESWDDALFPAEIRLRTGEILFVSKDHANTLYCEMTNGGTNATGRPTELSRGTPSAEARGDLPDN